VFSAKDAIAEGNYGRAALSVAQVAVTAKGMTPSAREVAEDTREGVQALVEGRLSVASNAGFDRGQREAAERLNLNRVPTRYGNHAEENLMAAKENLTAVGTSRTPCGPARHDCASQLQEKGIKRSPFLDRVATEVHQSGVSEQAINRRTMAVGSESPKRINE
jgi:hypothetical protein